MDRKQVESETYNDTISIDGNRGRYRLCEFSAIDDSSIEKFHLTVKFNKQHSDEIVPRITQTMHLLI